MNKELNCIMLINDDPTDNFFHEREIKKNNLSAIVITKSTGMEALEYLKLTGMNNYPNPELIFLDVNMPVMNGWDFLEEYNKLDKELQNKAIIIMLTTAKNYKDEERSKTWNVVSDYITKPLTKEIMIDITNKHFKE